MCKLFMHKKPFWGVFLDLYHLLRLFRPVKKGFTMTGGLFSVFRRFAVFALSFLLFPDGLAQQFVEGFHAVIVFQYLLGTLVLTFHLALLEGKRMGDLVIQSRRPFFQHIAKRLYAGLALFPRLYAATDGF